MREAGSSDSPLGRHSRSVRATHNIRRVHARGGFLVLLPHYGSNTGDKLQASIMLSARQLHPLVLRLRGYPTGPFSLVAPVGGSGPRTPSVSTVALHLPAVPQR